ncbi:response regulator [Nonomuraea jiangxiensis]|uniref:DNA-binding response regulator, NarL/FixJ family, contains REC and HTH domains n=1 Tax=Nonomuraea jiangxiensis TaxID=633440 RepID=A0A1G9L564_9ACTN|nr:response regulator transcription factor [Nonomuraea jiangxiensis]SDL57100.1 DNA-binding response regulator, NarL/FixJ family, contains REC and HTH domains [Nonomuraea jiangxiensis]
MTFQERIRVLLVDDHELVRKGFKLMLDAQPDLAVVGEASDGEQAVELSRRLKPDVVLMDLHMPGLDGVGATALITSELPQVRVLALSTFDLDENVVAALRAGADGFLPKDVSPEELIEGVRVVHRGESAVAPRLLTRLIGTFVRPSRPRQVPVELTGLTEREREILVLIARGRSNPEIASDLSVSPSTVKNHVTSLFAKIGVRDRAQAVIVAYEAALIRPGE